MAYDLVIGRSSLAKHDPLIFGSLDFDEYPSLARIVKNNNNWFFNDLQNLFDDRTYQISELEEASLLIDKAILSSQNTEDLAVLYKISSAVSMALRMELPLHGIAD